MVSSWLASMFMPAPGWTMLMTTRPTSSAIVLTISKYRSARPPVLPTFFMSSMPAMPMTTVQKMIGAMIILISLMKPSPSGFIAVAGLGPEMAEQHADHDRGDDLEVEGLVEGLGCGFVSMDVS